MSWGTYGVLIVLALFIILMITNPKLSCFGRRIKSPLYPLLRKKKKKLKTHDYGFKLVDQPSRRKEQKTYPKTDLKGIRDKAKIKDDKKVNDYGFHLD